MSVQAAITSDSYMSRALVYSISDSPAFAERLAETYESMGEGARCMKGFLVAFGLEAFVALSVIGAWQLWHILR
jgi:hypothetical protein